MEQRVLSLQLATQRGRESSGRPASLPSGYAPYHQPTRRVHRSCSSAQQKFWRTQNVIGTCVHREHIVRVPCLMRGSLANCLSTRYVTRPFGHTHDGIVWLVTAALHECILVETEHPLARNLGLCVRGSLGPRRASCRTALAS